MYPILFQLGPIPIHTYGFLIAIGFLVAVSVIKKLAERSQLDVNRVLDLVFWTMLVGFAGARTLFVLTRFDYFSNDLLAIFKIWEGGLVFFGGPLAAIPFVVWYVRRFRLPLWATMDAMVPGLAVAHAFGRLGCVAAGCCYGKPTGSDWGIQFNSQLVDSALHGVNLHPVQLYESAAVFTLFLGLLFLHPRKRFDGQVVLTYFMAYPIIRSVTEIFRGDLIRGFVIDEVLSTSQFISLIVFIFAAAILKWRLSQLKRSGA